MGLTFKWQKYPYFTYEKGNQCFCGFGVVLFCFGCFIFLFRFGFSEWKVTRMVYEQKTVEYQLVL